jgi:hypothetical protein
VIYSHLLDPAGLQAAQTVLQKYPLNDQTPHDSTTAFNGTAQLYAVATWVVGNDFLVKQSKPLEALSLCDAYLKVFPTDNGYWPPRVVALFVKASVGVKLPAGEALLRAQAVSKYVVEGRPIPPETNMLTDLLVLYEAAAQKDEGRKFFEGLPYARPDIVEIAGYWQARVRILLLAGEQDMAKAAALAAYQLAPVAEKADEDPSLKLLLRVLTVTEGPTVTTAFLTYLQTGEGQNPLADIPALPITAEQRQTQQAAVGGSLSLAVDAFLLNRQYPEAMHAAQLQAVMEGQDAATGLTNTARCFKAKDLYCRRAQEYVDWVKSGAGTNPISSY